MNWLDLLLLLIIAGSVYTSFRKGLSREVIGLVTVCCALLLGIWLYGNAGSYLLPYLSSRSVANFAGFGIVFCGVLLLGSVVSAIAGRFLKITGLSLFDHVLGAGFGIVRGILISVALITAILAFSPGDAPPAPVVNSRMAPYVASAARVVTMMAPYELKQGFRKTYEKVKSAWEEAAHKKGLRSFRNAGKAENEREI